MRHISEDRLHRVQLLAQRLEEIKIASHQLFLQLEVLATEARGVRLEHNTLHNLVVAPISVLSDDALAMVFETGMRLEQPHEHFGPLVSHVTRHWRTVALSTPRLWTRIIWNGKSAPMAWQFNSRTNREKWRERAVAFLSRSKSLPLDISIINFRPRHFKDHFLQLVSEHIGHCRQLCIQDADVRYVMRALTLIARQPTPILNSIHLAVSGEEFVDQEEEDLHRSLPPGSMFPHLTIAQLDETIFPFLSIFRSVTSLRLTDVHISPIGDQEYASLREGLMALTSLNHLELTLQNGFGLNSRHLPTVLPTIQFLHLDVVDCPDYLHSVIQSIHAESLTVLSVDMGDEKTFEELPYIHPSWEHQFPLLQHLILANVPDEPYFGGIALSSSTIKRLTFQFVGREWVDDTYDILAAMLTVSLGRYYLGDDSGPRIWWPELQTLAVSAPLAPRILQNMTAMLQNLNRQIPKLMLTKHSLDQAGTEAMGELEKEIKVEDFTLDWPTPFEQFK